MLELPDHMRVVLLLMFSLIPAFTGMLALGLLPTNSMKWTRWGMYMMQVTGSLAGLSIYSPDSLEAAAAEPCQHEADQVPTKIVLWSFLPSNVAGRTKKTVTATVLFVAYCVGNAVGAQMFVASDAPRYTRGITACGIIYCIQFCSMGSWRFYCEPQGPPFCPTNERLRSDSREHRHMGKPPTGRDHPGTRDIRGGKRAPWKAQC